MGFWDVLLGRTRVPPARIEPLFALTTARITLEAELGWSPAGRAGLVMRPAEDSAFAAATEEALNLVRLAGRELGSQAEVQKDEYGYTWFLFADPDWEDLVALVHMAGQTLIENGYSDRLLTAVFRLEKKEAPAPVLYLVFHYKRGAFYPFLPLPGRDKERDHAGEMRLFALLEKELPWEKDLSRWYPLWDCPL
ncbi:MAG: PspA-associated protein PspAB [Moorellaceae bacterium]